MTKTNFLSTMVLIEVKGKEGKLINFKKQEGIV